MSNFWKQNKKLIIGLIVFVILRLPSLFEPYWYSDEGIYASVAREMKFGEILYREIWDNKPLPIYLTYLFAMSFPSLEFFLVIRFFNLIAGIFTVWGFFNLSKKLIKNEKGQKWAFFSFIFLLALPVFEGRIANAENFFLPLIIWSGNWILEKEISVFKKFLSGLFLALAFFYKYVAIFDILVLGVYFLLVNLDLLKSKFIFEKVKKTCPYLVGAIFIFSGIFIYQYLNGSLLEFWETTVKSIFNYISWQNNSSFWFSKILASSYFKLGLFLLFELGMILLFHFKKISKSLFFIISLMVAEFMGSVISTRYYAHYLLQFLPGVCLFMGFIIGEIIKAKNIFSKMKLGLLIFAVWSVVGMVFIHEKIEEKIFLYIPEYYFYSFKYYILNLSKDKYEELYNNETLTLLSLKEELETNFRDYDRVYIYTDKGWTYPYLGLRVPTIYAVSYHRYVDINGTEKLMTDLDKFEPNLIVKEKEISSFSEFDELLENYTLMKEDETYQFFIKN